MKLKLRDYLTVTLALLAVFLCGYGVGFLLGEKKGRSTNQLEPQPSSPVVQVTLKSEWTARLLERFEDDLQLTADQRIQVGEEIESIYPLIIQNHLSSRRDHNLHLIELHTKILPFLDEGQSEKVKAKIENLREK